MAWLVARCIAKRQLVIRPNFEASSSAVPSPRPDRARGGRSERLHCERFVDKAPAQVWATLLDEEPTSARFARCIGFWRSSGEVRERRGTNGAIRTTPRPELLAEAPGTRFGRGILRSFVSPVKWTYYYRATAHPRHLLPLRGWLDSWLTEKVPRFAQRGLIAESCRKQDIEPDQLTLHADRGSSMRSTRGSAPG